MPVCYNYLHMTRNPFINALAATVYISIVASIIFYGTNYTGPVRSVIIPIAMISLFTLSVAVMGYIFGSQPIQLYLDGKKKHAVNLFLQTVAVFAAITALILSLLFSRVLV